MKQRHTLHHRLIQPIARVLRRQNPLHACFGRGFDERCLFAHGHEAEGEDRGVDVLESGCEEGGIGVGAFLEGDGGAGGESGG